MGVEEGVSCRKVLGTACICHGEGVGVSICPCSTGHKDPYKGLYMEVLGLLAFHEIYGEKAIYQSSKGYY